MSKDINPIRKVGINNLTLGVRHTVNEERSRRTVPKRMLQSTSKDLLGTHENVGNKRIRQTKEQNWVTQQLHNGNCLHLIGSTL